MYLIYGSTRIFVIRVDPYRCFKLSCTSYVLLEEGASETIALSTAAERGNDSKRAKLQENFFADRILYSRIFKAFKFCVSEVL